MNGHRGVVISGWPAILLSPILFPVALIAALLPFKKTKDRSATEVAGYLRDAIEGTGGDWDWDDFESVPITDRELDQIRHEAALAGLLGTDLGKLRELLARAEALI